MKKVAVLLDGAFVLHRMYTLTGRQAPTVAEVYDFATRCLRPDEEELFRVYFYHCPPFGGRERHPVSRLMIDFATTLTYRANQRLLAELAEAPYVAVCAGEPAVG